MAPLATTVVAAAAVAARKSPRPAPGMVLGPTVSMGLVLLVGPGRAAATRKWRTACWKALSSCCPCCPAERVGAAVVVSGRRFVLPPPAPQLWPVMVALLVVSSRRFVPTTTAPQLLPLMLPLPPPP